MEHLIQAARQIRSTTAAEQLSGLIARGRDIERQTLALRTTLSWPIEDAIRVELEQAVLDLAAAMLALERAAELAREAASPLAASAVLVRA
jgi:hypothetical protein